MEAYVRQHLKWEAATREELASARYAHVKRPQG